MEYSVAFALTLLAICILPIVGITACMRRKKDKSNDEWALILNVTSNHATRHVMLLAEMGYNVLVSSSDAFITMPMVEHARRTHRKLSFVHELHVEGVPTFCTEKQFSIVVVDASCLFTARLRETDQKECTTNSLRNFAQYMNAITSTQKLITLLKESSKMLRPSSSLHKLVVVTPCKPCMGSATNDVYSLNMGILNELESSGDIILSNAPR